MRKTISLFLCLALLALLAAGCSAANNPAPLPTPAPTEPAAPAPAPTEPPAAEAAVPPSASPDPTPTEPPAAEPEESPEDPGGPIDPLTGRYRFRPKVCSSFLTEIFGEPARDAWFALVDAVLAGEDSFPCPDEACYALVMHQFSDQCFPLLSELIEAAENQPAEDGRAVFRYKLPREEAAARIEEFAALVEEILNENLEADDSDFEKALILYIYFSNTYSYDYETHFGEEHPDYLSSYRVLGGQTGICQEISAAYTYMLLQAGLDATCVGGIRPSDQASHQWSYVKLRGQNYHIDPTYGVGRRNSLRYFLMDDAQRTACDGYRKADFAIWSDFTRGRPVPDYSAEDAGFRPIWEGWFLRIDRETQTLYYEIRGTDPAFAESFDYTGW